MSRQNLFDPSPLAELRAIDDSGQLVNGLIKLFEETTPNVIVEILAAANTQDFEKARHLAHSLKSSAGNLGGMALSGVCAEIEEKILGKEPNLVTKIPLLAKELNELFLGTLQAIKNQVL